jgi:hypothetical protein
MPKKNRQNPKKTIQLNNQIPADEVSENAPDYLPPSVYRNLEPMQQKPHEDTIHPVRSSHATNSKEPAARPKKRHSRPLKLTGEVNLGTDRFIVRDKKQRKKQKPVEIPAADIEEAVTNAGRHHHHKHPNDIPEIESTSLPAPTLVFETTPEPEQFVERTTSSVVSSVEAKKKLDEKALRRERLKAKLAALSPEEQQAFLLMKKQRAEAKRKGLTFN